MVQHFMIMNVDRQQIQRLGKFRELYYNTTIAMYLCDHDPQYSWAGNRLILIGEYVEDFPEGVQTKVEVVYERPYGWPGSVTTWAAESLRPREDKTYGETSVLRNLCSREYIRASLFPGTNGHPGLGEALIPKIIWTSDSSDISLGLLGKAHIDIHGAWAGARMDIVELSVVENDPVWKDITEVAFFDFYDVWSRDMNGPDECTCALCTKYRDEKESFYEDRLAERERKRDNPSVRRVQAVAIAEAISSDAGHQERVPVSDVNEPSLAEPNRPSRPARWPFLGSWPSNNIVSELGRLLPLEARGFGWAGSRRTGGSLTSLVPVVRDAFSPLEKLPGEVQAYIFVNLSTRDLAACAVTSHVLSREATRRLYRSVRLVRAERTIVLLQTLATHPEYARYIRDLRVVTMAHWESLQVAHDILKQLPLLTSLEFAPCWFSYGDLPYWEYPFELQTLKSGLRDDDGFEMFRRSQVGLSDP